MMTSLPRGDLRFRPIQKLGALNLNGREVKMVEHCKFSLSLSSEGAKS